ncbi:MAG: hypothetical protein HFP77_03605 [Methylococcales symbiont of Iophon sp. n. MRB-2018]|nr:MAG: hypothetical protein HFP77_03605 [Methylococcales symbiont of Iophon sp. n. MRB-2018]KAF3979257.1 MAG: hypothetical protein HFP76_08275 [Methylococcales symbiont of Iophon sp. n. MRB-2018]
MPQGYHTNAKTKLHSREIIQQSSLSNAELSKRFAISEQNNPEQNSWIIGWTTFFIVFEGFVKNTDV